MKRESCSNETNDDELMQSDDLEDVIYIGKHLPDSWQSIRIHIMLIVWVSLSLIFKVLNGYILTLIVGKN